jgi:hypothetical protein
MNESMILKCRSVAFLAAGAGGIKWDQAYQWWTSGSTTTFGRKYSASDTNLLAGRVGVGCG